VRIFDTDAMTVWLDPRNANHDRLIRRFDPPDAPRRATTVVSLHEQMRGWLANIHRARKAADIIREYANFVNAFNGYHAFQLLPYDAAAHAKYEALRALKLRVGTRDLRIAAIALANSATLLTRNLRDFRQVPGLAVEDWAR
jgi:tRNA(fMet)-specific endonuclease VapC